MGKKSIESTNYSIESTNYSHILTGLQSVNDIDNFIVDSIAYFLNQSDDPSMIAKCGVGTTVYQQVADLVKDTGNYVIKDYMQKIHGKAPLKNIYQTIKGIGSDYICLIIEHIRITLSRILPPEDITRMVDILLAKYKSFRKIYDDFQKL